MSVSIQETQFYNTTCLHLFNFTLENKSILEPAKLDVYDIDARNNRVS